MGRKLQVGNRVEVFHETLKNTCYGLGTIENIGHYFGGKIAYFVRLDLYPNSVGGYKGSQLRLQRTMK